MTLEMIVESVKASLLKGKIPPWKAEEAAAEQGLAAPDYIIAGIMARRAFVEEKSGRRFHHIILPDKPYLVNYHCPQDGTVWSLAADDSYIRCGICSTALELSEDSAERYQPLVKNYLGGVEDYFSYAGEVTVNGDVDKTFQNILIWGTGQGHLGISVGCFQLNKFGPIEVSVSEWGGAARNLAFVFDSAGERESAKHLIKEQLPVLIPQMTQAHLAAWQGEVYDVDFVYRQHHRDYILHCGFYTRFVNHRGHGQTSHAVGMAKNLIDELFRANGLHCRVSVVGMGRDADLKPSPRNRRGRYVSARQRIPIRAYEQIIGRSIDDFLSYLELDRQGVLDEVGWPAYTGMGGEIIPAFYRTMKVNPRPHLVSSYQKVYAETRGDDLILGVELPNVEVGITSSSEGIIPPAAREAMAMAGITTAKEYAAAVAALTLGGEYNFATLHIKEKMYTGR